MSGESGAPVRSLFARSLRALLFALGVGALVLVVLRVGAQSVLGALLTAGPWIPLLLALEAGWMGMDVFVVRALLGERAARAPASAYVRSAIDAYAVNILAPAGRASGEVVRALVLAPHVGTGPVASVAVGVHGSGLLGNAGIAAVCFTVLAARIGPTAHLSLLVAGNAMIAGAAGTALLLGSRSARVWRVLRRIVKSLPPVDEAARAQGVRPFRAVLLSLSGRAVETFLWLVLIRAGTGVSSMTGAFGAQAVELVASLFGDLVPQRAGVTEGAFWLFGADIDLPSPAAAVAVALLYRVNQLMLAALCLLTGLVWRRRRAGAERDAAGRSDPS